MHKCCVFLCGVTCKRPHPTRNHQRLRWHRRQNSSCQVRQLAGRFDSWRYEYSTGVLPTPSANQVSQSNFLHHSCRAAVVALSSFLQSFAGTTYTFCMRTSKRCAPLGVNAIAKLVRVFLAQSSRLLPFNKNALSGLRAPQSGVASRARNLFAFFISALMHGRVRLVSALCFSNLLATFVAALSSISMFLSPWPPEVFFHGLFEFLHSFPWSKLPS